MCERKAIPGVPSIEGGRYANRESNWRCSQKRRRQLHAWNGAVRIYMPGMRKGAPPAWIHARRSPRVPADRAQNWGVLPDVWCVLGDQLLRANRAGQGDTRLTATGATCLATFSSLRILRHVARPRPRDRQTSEEGPSLCSILARRQPKRSSRSCWAERRHACPSYPIAGDAAISGRLVGALAWCRSG